MVNLKDRHSRYELLSGCQLEVKQVNSKGDTSVDFDGRFLFYLKLEKAQALAKALVEIFNDYSPSPN